jgi:hypothetical protein
MRNPTFLLSSLFVLSRRAVVLAFALLVACAPGAQSPVASEDDVSSPLADGDVPLTIDAASIKRSVRGSVASIAAVSDARGWFDVVIAGDDAPSTRTLRLGTRARLPFTAGESLDVRWSQRQIGWDAWAVDVEVRGESGALWAGLYTTMAEHDGWSFEILPAAADTPCRVAVTHQSRRAIVPTGAWRRLETPDGVWAASAECPGSPPTLPGQPPPNDYSPDPTVVAISRLAGP